MKQIHLNATFRIQDGKRAEFEAIGAEMIELIRKNEPDIVQYMRYFTEDGQTCTVREIYKSSDAVMAHVANVGAELQKLMAIAAIELEVYGPVSDELRDALKPFNAPILSFHGGIDRALDEA